MPQTENTIRLTYTDQTLNTMLKQAAEGCNAFSRHYNQVEEFFLRFDREFLVPQLPIHHDVRNPTPETGYLKLLAGVLEQLLPLAPQVFRDLKHLFDPAEVLRPSFFTVYRIENNQYLYLLRLDLMPRPQIHRVVRKGSNDLTAAYSSNVLFLESSFIPLKGIQSSPGGISSFLVDQSISNTWVDESGRGYFVQGIWIDNDLTKFFSKLFLPEKKRTYPFYPFVCKYKTVCLNVIDLDAETRRKTLPYLHRALAFLRPVMGEIEAALRDQDFSERNTTFQNLRRKVPPAWTEVWKDIRLEVYLDEQDMKEYRIEDTQR